MAPRLADITNQTGFLVVKDENNNPHMDFCYVLQDAGSSLGLVYRPLNEHNKPADTLVFVAHLSSTEETAKTQFQNFLTWVKNNAETLKQQGITKVVSTGDHNINLASEKLLNSGKPNGANTENIGFFTKAFNQNDLFAEATFVAQPVQKTRGIQQQLNKVGEKKIASKDYLFTIDLRVASPNQNFQNSLTQTTEAACKESILSLDDAQSNPGVLDHVALKSTIGNKTHNYINIFSLEGSAEETAHKNILSASMSEWTPLFTNLVTQMTVFFGNTNTGNNDCWKYINSHNKLDHEKACSQISKLVEALRDTSSLLYQNLTAYLDIINLQKSKNEIVAELIQKAEFIIEQYKTLDEKTKSNITLAKLLLWILAYSSSSNDPEIFKDGLKKGNYTCLAFQPPGGFDLGQNFNIDTVIQARIGKINEHRKSGPVFVIEPDYEKRKQFGDEISRACMSPRDFIELNKQSGSSQLLKGLEAPQDASQNNDGASSLSATPTDTQPTSDRITGYARSSSSKQPAKQTVLASSSFFARNRNSLCFTGGVLSIGAAVAIFMVFAPPLVLSPAIIGLAFLAMAGLLLMIRGIHGAVQSCSNSQGSTSLKT